jgi:hypothetical protein
MTLILSWNESLHQTRHGTIIGHRGGTYSHLSADERATSRPALMSEYTAE